MKKMVCEICGSQQIKKENGSFKCMECGTEYSVEEARNLLKEIDDQATDNTEQIATQQETDHRITVNNENKVVLLNKLLVWYDYLKKIGELNKGFIALDGDFFDLKSKLKIKYFYPNKDDLIKALKEAFKQDNPSFMLELNHPVDSSFSVEFKKFAEMFANKYIDNKKEETHITQLMSMYAKLGAVKGNLTPSLFDKKGGISFTNLLGVGIRIEGTIEAIPPAEKSDNSFLKWVIGLSDVDRIDLSFYNIKPIAKKEEFKFNEVDYDELLNCINFVVEDMMNEYSLLYNDILLYKASLDEKLIELRSKLDKMNEMFALPTQYRNNKTLGLMIKIIMDGKADNWKETMMVYDTTVFQSAMLMSAVEIAKAINNCIDEIRETNYNLSELNQQTYVMSRQISELSVGGDSFINKSQYWTYVSEPNRYIDIS